MLNIQVLGKGLIPRGYGLAPRKQPFKADLNHIGIILATPGLIVNYVNPDDGRLLPLNNKNLKRVWERYGNRPTNKPPVQSGNSTPPPATENNDDTGSKDPNPPAPITPPPVQPVPNPPMETPTASSETQAEVKEEKAAEGAIAEESQPAAENGATNSTETPSTEVEGEKTDDNKEGETSTNPLRPILSPEEIARRKQQSDRDRNRNGGRK